MAFLVSSWGTLWELIHDVGAVASAPSTLPASTSR